MNLKEQYPEIAAMTVAEVINSKEFEEQYKLALKAFNPHKNKNFYAYKSLQANKILEPENFKKAYIECIDKQSKEPFSKRVVIFSIGNNAYSRTIQKMIEDYEKK